MTPIPHSVTLLLTRAIARVRRLRLLRGLATVGIAALAGIMAVMAFDAHFVIFDDRLRWAMTAGIVLLTVAVAVRAIVLPLRRKLDFRTMAKTLDARHPEQEERLSTLVELSEAPAGKSGFSASLFALVGKLAENDAARLDLLQEFPLRPVLRRLGLFALLLLALVVGIVSSPNLVGRLFVRAVAPWVDMGNLFADEIAVNPGDVVALAGTVIRIEAKPHPSSLIPHPSSYTIRLSRRRGAGWTEETTEAMANGVYETTADLAEREWRYRINAGPAVTRYYRVRVSERPKYESFLARVDYPSYTGFSPSVHSNADVGTVKAIAGSRVSFDLKVSEPGTVADFRIGGEPVFEHVMQSNRTVNWELELVNRDGFRSSMGCHPLISESDQPPTLVIEKPAQRLPALPPHAKIPVELTASDDVRVLRPVVHCSVDGGETRVFHEVEEFASAGGNLWRGKTDLDLATLDLTSARGVRFFFVVRDNCPTEYGGPHVVTSSVINVTLAAREWGLEIAGLKEESKRAGELIEEAKRRMRDAENLSRQLREELRRDGKVSEQTEQKTERAAHEATEAKKRLEELRERFEKDERFAPLAKPVKRTMAEKLAPALEKIENSPFRERDERAQEMQKAADDLRAAQEQAEEIAKQLRERTDKLDAYERAKDLSERQEALARSAQEILEERPNDIAKLEAWKRLEEEAMRRADDLMRQKPDADLAEARRKMETAARKISELKSSQQSQPSQKSQSSQPSQSQREAQEKAMRQAGALRDAAQQQAQARQAMQQAASRREEERRARAANNSQQAENKSREAERAEAHAFSAQQAAEDRLERAEGMEGLKALQRQATELECDARASRQAPDKAAAALKAQEAAMEALKREQEILNGICKGQKTPEDLAAFDEALGKALQEQTAARAAEARAAAAKALQKAQEAESSAKPEEIERLADAALQTSRDAIAAERAAERAAHQSHQSQSSQQSQQSQREALQALDAVRSQAAEEEAREARILAGQKTALEGLGRKDGWRAKNVQHDIAKEQFRAAESATGEEEVAARAAANAAQEAARSQLEDAIHKWNTAEARDRATAAQKAAFEREQLAQAESRARRARDKIAAAQLSQPSNIPTFNSQPSTFNLQLSTFNSQPSRRALEAAKASAEALSRGVKSQAKALGIENAEPREGEVSEGGGVSSEVSRLAQDLRRSDGPDALKKLFSRLGWFKIGGLSKDSPDTLDLKDVPREYRDLVRRYFLKLAEEGRE